LGDALQLTLRWVAEAVGGVLRGSDPQQLVGNVVIDSRTVQAGDLFVALRGDRHDAHDFVAQTIGQRAVGAVVERGRLAADLDVSRSGQDKRFALIEVSDTTRALQDLARAVRRASGTRVIAITGSAGKTTTKEAVAELLPKSLRVVRNKGNLNNHIGLPISLLQLRERPDVAVVELGMNHAGEISTLVGIAEPETRVWTNVGDAHIGFFQSADAIADAKAEILERGEPNHLLVCNADDARIRARMNRFAGRTVTFGMSSDAMVRAVDVETLGVDGMRARVVTAAGERMLRTPLLGRGNLSNVLAATAVALEFGSTLDEIEAGMAAAAVRYVEKSELAAEEIATAIRPGDLVLVKGSRGIRTDIVADRIATVFA
jgi:UDP-N-acetylmuramoyl-tripeptide--D-alanyl-D-alanine ligase